MVGGASRSLPADTGSPGRSAGSRSLEGRDLTFRIAVVAGDARSALLDVAADRSADLLVVGSRGLGPLANLLLGSVATSLAQHSELPVTIVPQAP